MQSKDVVVGARVEQGLTEVKPFPNHKGRHGFENRGVLANWESGLHLSFPPLASIAPCCSRGNTSKKLVISGFQGHLQVLQVVNVIKSGGGASVSFPGAPGGNHTVEGFWATAHGLSQRVRAKHAKPLFWLHIQKTGPKRTRYQKSPQQNLLMSHSWRALNQSMQILSMMEAVALFFVSTSSKSLPNLAAKISPMSSNCVYSRRGSLA
eukprot:3329944-Amphidinium_carterae.1